MTSNLIATSFIRGTTPELSGDHREQFRAFLETDAGRELLSRLTQFSGGAESSDQLAGRRATVLMLLRLAGYSIPKPEAAAPAYPPLDDDRAWNQ